MTNEQTQNFTLSMGDRLIDSDPDTTVVALTAERIDTTSRVGSIITADIARYGATSDSTRPGVAVTTLPIYVAGELVADKEVDMDAFLANTYGQRIGRQFAATPTHFEIVRYSLRGGDFAYECIAHYPLTLEEKVDRVLDLLDVTLSHLDEVLLAHNICPECYGIAGECVPDAEPDAEPAWTDAIDSTATAN